MSALLNDPTGPPPQQVLEQMMTALRSVQAAMERLQAANTGQRGNETKPMSDPPGT